MAMTRLVNKIKTRKKPTVTIFFILSNFLLS
jgi:hypothetical protein